MYHRDESLIVPPSGSTNHSDISFCRGILARCAPQSARHRGQPGRTAAHLGLIAPLESQLLSKRRKKLGQALDTATHQDGGDDNADGGDDEVRDDASSSHGAGCHTATQARRHEQPVESICTQSSTGLVLINPFDSSGSWLCAGEEAWQQEGRTCPPWGTLEWET